MLVHIHLASKHAKRCIEQAISSSHRNYGSFFDAIRHFVKRGIEEQLNARGISLIVPKKEAKNPNLRSGKLVDMEPYQVNWNNNPAYPLAMDSWYCSRWHGRESYTHVNYRLGRTAVDPEIWTIV